MNSSASDRTFVVYWAGPMVATLAIVLYLVSHCREAFPVASGFLITTHLGIDPFQSYQNSLWSLLLHLVVAMVPLGSVALRANLLSVPLAGLSVWLMYDIVSRIPHDRTTEETLSGFNAKKIGAISGAFAAGFLAISPPFWFIATRAHSLTVDVALLLGCTALLVRQAQQLHRISLYLCSILLGIAMVQFPTMILLSPLFGLGILYVLWRAGELKVGPVLTVACLTLLGYASLLLVAFWFTGSETYSYRELDGFWALVLRIIKDQYVALARGVPKVGWLSVLLFAILPWFIVVVFPKRVLMRRQAMIGSHILHAVMVGVGVLILFNSQIAPFHILELRSLLVTPYLFVASWMGYLAGYWHIMWTRTRRHEDKSMTRLRHFVGRFHLPVLVLTIGAAAWTNHELVSPAHGEAAARAARQVVQNLDGRNRLLSNGNLDPMIQLAAHEAGKELLIIDMTRAHLDPYQRYLKSLFEEPRLKSLVDIGISQVLSEWARIDADMHKKLAVLSNSDFWFALQRVPVPAGIMFLGEQEGAGGDVPRDMTDDLKFFETMAELLDSTADAPRDVGRYNSWLRQHISKVANNTGYFLEEHEQPDAARIAYTASRSLSDDNISALMNLSQLATRENLPEAETLAEELETYIDRLDKKLPFWVLSTHCGYVRDLQAQLDRGRIWAVSGKPGAAIREYQRAVKMSGTSVEGALQLALADLYGREGDDEASEELYSAYLQENPEDLGALRGLARLEMQRGNFDMARSYLARAAALPTAEFLVAVEQASVELMSGNLEQAAAHLDRALQFDPENIKAISMRMLVAKDLDDQKVADLYREKIELLSATSWKASVSLAELAIKNGQLEVGRAYLEGVLEQDMSKKSAKQRGEAQHAALTKLLALDRHEGRMDLGEKHVAELLKLSPRNVQANMILGSILFARGELEQAEAAFAVCLEQNESSEALNSLGWIRVEQGNFEEGLELADRALALNDLDYSAWDTRGNALMKLDRLDEAEAALLKAVEYSRGRRPSMLINLAEVYERSGDNERALDIAHRLEPLMSDLPEDLADRVSRMLSRLR